ncbi:MULTISPECIES: hypothetical protein [Pseudomonadati]|uniref:Uncharacterized protein n=1 Tax=Shewanella aestuarii TaxID=1028752 RepID=A0ABT0KY95_9GAMM|nr:hypothetical protein [Shewanella aestuarii]MCL1116443.1 hypothetical protein [Shewanella aestuarii]GGN81980.1 hypothetical protein GCM10009193_28620 [Shewanella aestuarii]
MNNYATLIGQMPIDNHAIETKLSTWKKYELEFPDVWELIESLFSSQQTLKLSRLELKDIAKSKDYKKLIVATILWGYSSGMRGNNFSKIVKNIDNIVCLLDEAKNGVENWQSHFSKVKKISGLGLSTYSKFVYFVGGKVEGSEPLILDVRVIDAINTGLYQEFNCVRNITYTNAPTIYPEYLKAAKLFSANSNCSAEQVEMFLFMFGQNLKKHT